MLAACIATPSAALLIRPDRDDAEYLELATRYPSAISLGAQGGEGVLIAPRWVLTTARGASSSLRTRGSGLSIAGKRHAVQAVFAHPDADIDLVYLKDAVTGIEPTPIYRRDDEAGKGVVIVGHGPTGRIDGDAAARDGRKRAAINTVARVLGKMFLVAVKPLDDASDLQGALTPAETGAPAFIERDDDIRVAGLALRTEGGNETYLRVSAFAEWIDTTMLDAAFAEGRGAR